MLLQPSGVVRLLFLSRLFRFPPCIVGVDTASWAFLLSNPAFASSTLFRAGIVELILRYRLDYVLSRML
jgi:hypothetical protein